MLNHARGSTRRLIALIGHFCCRWVVWLYDIDTCVCVCVCLCGDHPWHWKQQGLALHTLYSILKCYGSDPSMRVDLTEMSILMRLPVPLDSVCFLEEKKLFLFLNNSPFFTCLSKSKYFLLNWNKFLVIFLRQNCHLPHGWSCNRMSEWGAQLELRHPDWVERLWSVQLKTPDRSWNLMVRTLVLITVCLCQACWRLSMLDVKQMLGVLSSRFYNSLHKAYDEFLLQLQSSFPGASSKFCFHFWWSQLWNKVKVRNKALNHWNSLQTLQTMAFFFDSWTNLLQWRRK